MNPLFANMPALTANAVFVVVYILIILEKLPKVVTALLGATALILLGVLTQEQAFGYIDFNVIFLLVGMMILVNILRQTGAFEWLAFFAARAVKGDGLKLMLVFAVLTAFFSAFLDNVTTILFMAAITCSLADWLKINPAPYLITEVIASNIGGTATLIGDPPNILIGSAAGLTFNDFLFNLAPVVLLILPVTLGTVYLYYRKDLVIPPAAALQMKNISLEGKITDKPLMIKALIILGLVLMAFVFHHVIHQEVGTIAMAGAALLMAFENFEDVWDDVEWTTIFFFIGLFIIVGALEEVGTLHFMAEIFVSLTQGDAQLMTLGLLWISGILSAVVDNIPYTATMIPLIQELGQSGQVENMEALWWALSLGACLGGNGTLIGATANVVAVDIALKQGHVIRFIDFLKIGSLVMVESLAISSIYLWWRYL